MTFSYLASPYSSPDPTVQQHRYEEALRATAWLMHKQGIHVFSPIVHCHELARRYSMSTDAKFWSGYNRSFMMSADEIIVLMIDGWDKSKGLRAELEFAKLSNMEVWVLQPPDTLAFTNQLGDIEILLAHCNIDAGFKL